VRFGRLVDDGFDAQRPPFLEVLLDPAVLVGEVHLHFGARAEDPSAELLRRCATTPVATEHDMNLLGSADADVVGDQRFEERAGAARIIEHHRA